MPLEYAVLNGFNVAYHTAGKPQNPTMLLIHGYISSYHVWRFMITRLQERFYCISIDLMGHGNTDKPDDPTPYTILKQAELCLKLLDTLGRTGEFSVMGHSMGGQIALCLASQVAPQRIKKLVNVAGVVAPRLSPSTEKTLPAWIDLSYRLPILLDLLRPLMRRVPRVAKMYYGDWFYDYKDMPFIVWRIDRDMATLPNIQFAFKHGWDAIHGYDVTPHLKDITASVLTIFGEFDAVALIEDGFTVKKHLPESTLEIIPECGHFPMFEWREIFEDKVMAWL